jgi:hypothetical protein
MIVRDYNPENPSLVASVRATLTYQRIDFGLLCPDDWVQF